MQDPIYIHPQSNEARSSLPVALSIVDNAKFSLLQAQVAPSAQQASDLASIAEAARCYVEGKTIEHIELKSPRYSRVEHASAAPFDQDFFDVIHSEMSRLISSSEPIELLSDLGPKGRAKMLSALDAYCLALADLSGRFSTD